MSARDPAAGFDALAELVDRLAVLLSAGLPPGAAWRLLDGRPELGSSDASSAPDPAALVAHARDLPAPERDAWLVLGALWGVAAEAGAPLAPTLVRVAELLRDLAQAARDVDVALAGPAATARVVLVLPALGLAGAQLTGVDAVGSLLGSVAGVACLVIGLALVGAALVWTRRLLARARAADVVTGVDLDALALALSGGAPPERARALVEDALARAGLPGASEELDRQLAFAERAGVPLAGLLRAEAVARRRRARAAVQRAAAALGTRLLLPLGLCVLPAFVLLGVVPVVLALVSSTAGSW